jgi:nicotinamidase-related amidase
MIGRKSGIYVPCATAAYPTSRSRLGGVNSTALVVIDLQLGFDDPSWGRRNNPNSERNAVALAHAWRDAGQPLIIVQHGSVEPGSPLVTGTPGHRLRPELAALTPDLLVRKRVHSAFHGKDDLDAWLGERGVRDLVLAGIQTNRCVETTARVGGDLGYRVLVALDATHTYDATTPSGRLITADELTDATAANLHGEFATIADTATALASVG